MTTEKIPQGVPGSEPAAEPDEAEGEEATPKTLGAMGQALVESEQGQELLGFWGWLTSPRHKFPIHPMSAILILGSDWVLFHGTVLSFGLLTCFVSVFGFIVGGALTAWSQMYFARDKVGPALFLKSFLGGCVVGVPFPVTGSIVGGVGLLAAKLAGLQPVLAGASERLKKLKGGGGGDGEPEERSVIAVSPGAPTAASRLSGRQESAHRVRSPHDADGGRPRRP